MMDTKQLQDNFMAETSHHCLISVEAAQSHEGSLGMAHAFIDAVADCGADIVKFQTHIASAESTLDEPWRVKFSRQDSTRYDYWKRMEFTEIQWQELATHAREKKLTFLSSPFSVEAVKLLKKIGMPAWKVASGEINNLPLIEAMWETEKPILFSSGMSNFKELDTIIDQTRSRNIPFGIFQCTSEYPCLPQNWGLNMLGVLRERYRCPVGFSDHSGNIFAPLAAASLGADFIEVHATFSRRMFGPDVSSSITFEELAQLVAGIKQIKLSLNSPVNKDKLPDKVLSLRDIFGRSWSLKEDLPAGTVLAMEHLTLKKPGTGISYAQVGRILGKRLRRDKASNLLLRWEDIE